MTQQEADKIVMGMGCHPYSRLAMIDALLEGEKIGKREQRAIDEEAYTNEMRKLNDEWEANLAECKRQRDAYYDELTRLRQERAELIDKAKKAFCKAKECVPYEECHRANGGCFAMQRFREFMEK